MHICIVMILTCPSTIGFQRGDLAFAGVITVPLCSAQAWKSLFTTGLTQSLLRDTATLQLSGVTVGVIPLKNARALLLTRIQFFMSHSVIPSA